MNNKIYIFGAGGHAKVIIEIAEDCGIGIGGIAVDDPYTAISLFNIPISSNYLKEVGNWIIAVGDNQVRKKIATKLESKKYQSLIHTKATVSTRAKIGDGTVIMANAVVNSSASIGVHCILNTSSSVDHDCILEDFVHISPNVALAGNVTVGEGTHIGTGASVIPGIRIGKWCTIGAGCVVVRDVEDGVTLVGNPGKVIRK